MKKDRMDALIVTGVVSVAAGIMLASYLYSLERKKNPIKMAEKIIKECRTKIEEIEKEIAAVKSEEL